MREKEEMIFEKDRYLNFNLTLNNLFIIKVIYLVIIEENQLTNEACFLEQGYVFRILRMARVKSFP